MQLITNLLQANSVRREERDGRDFLIVEDVTIAQPMALNGGFVPAEDFAESVPGWDQVPLPIGHPVDTNGNYISAKSEAVRQASVTGALENPAYDEANDDLTGDLAIDVERTLDLGQYGQLVIDDIEEGNALEVSTAYSGDDGDSGLYEHDENGNRIPTYHEDVKTNIKPDHVALLPGALGPGKCACTDGCGVQPNDGVDANGGVRPVSGHVLGAGDTSTPPAELPGAGVVFANADGETKVYVNMQTPTPTDDGPLDNRSDDVSSNPTITANADVNVGDRVRWSSSNGSTEGRVRSTYDEDDEIPASAYQGDGSMDGPAALIAIYDENDDGDYEPRDGDYEGEARVAHKTDGDTLTLLDESWNEVSTNTQDGSDSDDRDDQRDTATTDSLSTNIRDEARTPEYDGTVSNQDILDDDSNHYDDESRIHLWWSLDDYLEGWSEATGEEYTGDPFSALSSIPDDARGWIAEKSLLGSADAETEDNLIMFDVVGPDNQLYEKRLESILGPEGARATIPETQREGARSVARTLLAEEFDHDFDGDTNSPDTNESDRTRRERFRAFLDDYFGDDSMDANDADCGCDHGHDQETLPMTDYNDDDLERIANGTPFSVRELRSYSEDKLDGLNSLVANADGADGSGDDPADPDDPGADGGSDGTDNGSDDDPVGDDPSDPDADKDGADNDDDPDNQDDMNDDIPEWAEQRFNEMQQRIEDQSNEIEALNANKREAEENYRDQLTDAIETNSTAYSEEVLANADIEMLESIARDVQSRSGSDWGAVDYPNARPDSTNDDADESNQSRSDGTMAGYTANDEGVEADD